MTFDHLLNNKIDTRDLYSLKQALLSVGGKSYYVELLPGKAGIHNTMEMLRHYQTISNKRMFGITKPLSDWSQQTSGSFSTEMVDMQGEPLTIKSIRQAVKAIMDNT